MTTFFSLEFVAALEFWFIANLARVGGFRVSVLKRKEGCMHDL